MEQPSFLNANLSSKESSSSQPTKKKAPTPQELISHYQSKGLDTQEASLKVIEDLQNVLFRVVSANSKDKKDKLTAEVLRKMDSVQNRVGIVDMKIDSKPGYFETFAIGVASGAAFRGFEAVWPHVFGGIHQIWTAVSSATRSSSSS